MPISVRLDDRTERTVRRLARRTGRTTSAVIREAIATLEQKEESSPEEGPTAYDRLAHLIGTVGGGDRHLSEETGKKFTKLVELKHRARRPR